MVQYMNLRPRPETVIQKMDNKSMEHVNKFIRQVLLRAHISVMMAYAIVSFGQNSKRLHFLCRVIFASENILSISFADRLNRLHSIRHGMEICLIVQ